MVCDKVEEEDAEEEEEEEESADTPGGVQNVADAKTRAPHNFVGNKQICFGTSLGRHMLCITLPLLLVTLCTLLDFAAVSQLQSV